MDKSLRDLRTAARKGDLEKAKQAIADGADPRADDSGALFLAAKGGHAALVEFLIPLSDCSANNSTALGAAAMNNHLECVSLLLPHSNVYAKQAETFNTLAKNGQTEAIKLFLPHFDPEKHFINFALDAATVSGHEETALAIFPFATPSSGDWNCVPGCGEVGSIPLLKKFIEAGAPEISLTKALKEAAKKGHADCVEFLIPMAEPAWNYSEALHCAAENGHLACVKLLIPVSNPEEENSSPLRFAIMNNFWDCARELFPVSNGQKALDYFKKNWNGDKYQEGIAFLESLIHAESLRDKHLSSQTKRQQTQGL